MAAGLGSLASDGGAVLATGACSCGDIHSGDSKVKMMLRSSGFGVYHILGTSPHDESMALTASCLSKRVPPRNAQPLSSKRRYPLGGACGNIRSMCSLNRAHSWSNSFQEAPVSLTKLLGSGIRVKIQGTEYLLLDRAPSVRQTCQLKRIC